MLDPRVRAHVLMQVAGLFERSGDPISAIVAYGEVILSGDDDASHEALQRVAALADRAWLPAREAAEES